LFCPPPPPPTFYPTKQATWTTNTIHYITSPYTTKQQHKNCIHYYIQYITMYCIIGQKHHSPSELVWDCKIAGVVETVNVVVTFSLPLLSTEVGLLVWFSKIVKICYNLYVAPKDELGRTPGFPLCFVKDWASHIGHVWGVPCKQGRLESPPPPPYTKQATPQTLYITSPYTTK
jgi:hypothetical protein